MVGKIVEIRYRAFLGENLGEGMFCFWSLAREKEYGLVLKDDLNGLCGFDLVLLTKSDRQIYCSLRDVCAP